MSIRNDSDEMARVDDVTIEKVKLSKEELDLSLFEYEQMKHSKYNETKIFGSIKEKKTIQLTNSSALNKLISSDFYQNIEKNFKANRNDNNFEEVQHVLNSLVERNCTTVKINYVMDMRLKLRTELKTKLNQLKANDSTEKSALVDLNELYKWMPVEKESITEKTVKYSAKKIESKSLLINDDENLIYTYYYNYYYQKFFKQIKNF